MKPSNLFKSDDRAVSPVIGVILMVAITVILAAVIGTFVLGLGDSLSDSTPQAQLNIEATGTSDNISITHRGGDPIQGADLQIVDGSGNQASGTVGDLSVGNSTEVDTGFGSGEKTIRVIHTPSDSIIAEQTVTLS